MERIEKSLFFISVCFICKSLCIRNICSNDPYLQISYGLNDTSSIYANAYLGLRGVKFLGINIGNIGKGWDWELLDIDKTVIPETALFQYKIN